MTMDLTQIRKDIDDVDEALLPLFLRRMELSALVAGEKAKTGAPVLNPVREREILSRVTREAGDMGDYARLMYGELFQLSRSYQTALLAAQDDCPVPEEETDMFPRSAVVACQGVEGAYSQLAADRAFSFADIMYMKTFEGVFQAVEKGLCRFGVLPIENSAHGSVTQVYDLMRSHQFSIVRTVKLHVSHSLLVKKGTKLSDIRVVVSHEQAVGQCSAFLSALRDVEIRLCENTAAAAQAVAAGDEAGIAAISSEGCAGLYGLEVLKSRIQNTDNNYTRFIVIEKTPRVYPNAGKISLLFSVPNVPGALANMMARFSCLDLNLSKLESRPVEGSDFHYVFYADLEASPRDPAVRRLLASLSRELPQFVFLGAYQEV